MYNSYFVVALSLSAIPNSSNKLLYFLTIAHIAYCVTMHAQKEAQSTVERFPIPYRFANFIFSLILCYNIYPKLLCLENPFSFTWNLKSSFEIWKLNLILKKKIPPENLFQTWTLQSGATFMCSSLSHYEVEYMHMAPLCRVMFKINFQMG